MILLAVSFLRRAGLLAGAATALVAGATLSAEAAAKKTDKKDEPAKPALVASFGDWNVFVGQTGKGRICYVLAEPKARQPSNLTRDPGYAFISDRPAEGVRNEVSFIMGYDVAPGAQTEAKADEKTDASFEAKPARRQERKAKAIAGPVATVDEATFELLPKGGDLWVKNAARESAMVAEMKKGSTLEIKAASIRGNASIDSYSLSGFAQAMERLQKECPLKSIAQ